MARGKVTSESDKDWQGECDAHTLSEAKMIMGDPKRMKAAAKAAGGMAEEHMDKAKAMKSIARKGGNGPMARAKAKQGKKK